MTEVEALRERMIALARTWVRAYRAIDAGEVDFDHADADHDFMVEMQELAGRLLEIEEAA